MGGAEQILPTIGPLSTSLEGCKLFTKTLINAKPWYKEPSLFPFPWNDEEFFKGKRLKIAILWDDGVVKPHPPVTRALHQIVDKLKAKGNVEIVDWKPYQHDLAWEIIVTLSPPLTCASLLTFYKANLYFADGGAYELEILKESGEPLLPLTKHIITENPHLEAHTVTSLWQSVEKRDDYRTAYANLWNSTASSDNGVLEGMVDVILCPAGPGVAPKIDTSKWWGYTSQWNLLDYPAIVFPVDKVSLEKEKISSIGTCGRNMVQKDIEMHRSVYSSLGGGILFLSKKGSFRC